MNLQLLLEQASWRLRGYLGAPSTDSQRVGWRCASACCPLAEWLLFEAEERGEDGPPKGFGVDRDEATWEGQIARLPLVLVRFIDLIDGHACVPFGSEWWAGVGRAEAETALQQAEREIAQRLLPMQAQSVARCEYCLEDGLPCAQPAIGPVIYTFLDLGEQPIAKPPRANCRLFLGHLCELHWRRTIAAPESWWPRRSTRRVEALLAETLR